MEPGRSGGREASTGDVAEEKRRERKEVSCVVTIQGNVRRSPEAGPGEVRLQISPRELVSSSDG